MITHSSQFGNLHESLLGFSLKIDSTLKSSCTENTGLYREEIVVYCVTPTQQRQGTISSSLAHMPKPAGIKFKLHGTTTSLSKIE
jgi:hypothetical protein